MKLAKAIEIIIPSAPIWNTQIKIILDITVVIPVKIQLIEKSSVLPKPLATCKKFPDKTQTIISTKINHLNGIFTKQVTIIYKILNKVKLIPNTKKLLLIS